MNSVFWITPFQVNYEYIFYLLDAASESVIQEEIDEPYINDVNIQNLDLPIDVENGSIGPLMAQLRNDSTVVSASFDNLYYFSRFHNCRKTICSQITISGISIETSTSRLSLIFSHISCSGYLFIVSIKIRYKNSTGNLRKSHPHMTCKDFVT